MTLEALIERLRQDKQLNPRKVRNLVSAIRSFARVTGCTLQAEASFPVVRRLVARANPGAAGVSKSSWANVRSNLTFALKRHGGTPSRKQLSPAWAALRQVIDDEPCFWRGLSSFMHWASAQGIEPEGVGDAVLEAFLHHLKEHTLKLKPEKRHRDVAQLWNRAAAAYPIWPKTTLTVPDRRRLVSIAWAAFPQCFRDDVDAYCRFMAGEDLTAEHAPSEPRRGSTLEHHRKQIRRLASALVHAGMPIDQVVDLSVLIEKVNFDRAIDWYAEWLGSTTAPSLRELLGTMIVLAREYLRVHQDRVAEIEAMLKRVPKRPKGMTPKNRERLRQFRDRRVQIDFLNLGDRLCHLAKDRPPIRAALLIQRALAHELLLVAPLRFGNLIGLHLERHFRFIGKGRQRRAFIVVQPDEVKNSQLLDFELPGRVIELLDDYLANHRPLLLHGPDKGYLFPGKDNGRKHEVGLREQLCTAVDRHVGITVNPHLYRHIAAFFHLQAHPGNYETVRQLLGHKSVDTTIAFYAEFEAIVARRRYAEHLDELRANPS